MVVKWKGEKFHQPESNREQLHICWALSSMSCPSFPYLADEGASVWETSPITTTTPLACSQLFFAYCIDLRSARWEPFSNFNVCRVSVNRFAAVYEIAALNMKIWSSSSVRRTFELGQSPVLILCSMNASTVIYWELTSSIDIFALKYRRCSLSKRLDAISITQCSWTYRDSNPSLAVWSYWVQLNHMGPLGKVMLRWFFFSLSWQRGVLWTLPHWSSSLGLWCTRRSFNNLQYE